jgi:U3 small nucleolar RNA-associated protein 21
MLLMELFNTQQWLFDSPTAAPRLLKFRTGHHSPPHLIRYYGEDGKQLLTASRDRSLRCTSVVRDSRSFEMSQGLLDRIQPNLILRLFCLAGSLAKKASTLSIPLASLKFPPIISLSFSSTRAKDWDDVITTHADETFARTWNVLGKKLGKHSLGFVDGTKKKGPIGSAKVRMTSSLATVQIIFLRGPRAQAVCVTACGNFGIGSSSTGDIYMWNLQSGIKRKSFNIGPCPLEVVDRFRLSATKKADRCVTGVASDSLNRVVIASTLDGTINVRLSFLRPHVSLTEATCDLKVLRFSLH